MKPVYEYDVQLPAKLDRAKKYPVLFTLHGKGSNERNMYSLTELLADDFIIIGIRGNRPSGPGFQYYELKSLGNPLREHFDQAVRQLEELIDAVTDMYPIDAKRRYLLGFSQGAILSMALALTMGNRLKGIVSLNGYVPGFVKTEYSHQSVQDVSVFVSHGEYDSVFPVSIGHETAAYFRELTPYLTFKLYPTDHTVSEENRRDFAEWLRTDAEAAANKK